MLSKADPSGDIGGNASSAAGLSARSHRGLALIEQCYSSAMIAICNSRGGSRVLEPLQPLAPQPPRPRIAILARCRWVLSYGKKRTPRASH